MGRSDGDVPGLSKGQKELRRRFDEAHACQPFRPDVCAQMIQGLGAKWGGSHEKMYEFARWIEVSADPASPARGALVLSHLEWALYEDDVQSADHFKTEAVRYEVEASAERFLAATPPTTHAMHLAPLNCFVLAIHPHDTLSAGLVSECVRRIDGRATGTPWSYWDDEVGAKYAKTSRRRLKAARQFA